MVSSVDCYNDQLNEIAGILEKCSSRVNCWGSRLIKARGVNFSLKETARTFKNAVEFLCKNNQIAFSTRVLGFDLLHKLRVLYQKTDAELKTRNVFIRFLAWLREFRVFDVTVRDFIEPNTMNAGYTLASGTWLSFVPKTQFIQYFTPADKREKIARELRNIQGHTYVKEERIRELVSPNNYWNALISYSASSN